MSTAGPGEIVETARRVFGYDELRPGQLEAIEAAVAGRDCLAVLPTGSGKSAIYQVAAVLRDGPTVVVSPLLALQRDQVERLDDVDAGGALEANSAVGEAARREALEEIGRGRVEFLFLAPEQLANDDTVQALRDARPSLLVVDEAHCISSWGHDFRPDYLRIGTLAQAMGRPPILALTATAAPPVQAEIVERLGMRDPALIVRGFDRPNIHLAVEIFRGPGADADKRQAVLERATALARAGSGIVYVATRRAAEEVTTWLAARDVRAAAYHGGMATKRRERVQAAFMDGDIDVIVATIAFGMGIDKPNVRFVLHHDAGGSLDSYHQEIGRAGRDGEPAQAVLFYRPEDLGLRRFFASGRIPVGQLEAVARAVRDLGATTAAVVAKATRIRRNRLLAILDRLERAGAVQLTGSVVRWRRRGPSSEAAVAEAAEAEEAQRSVERSRVEMVQAYAEARGCRRQVLLAYFGQQLAGPCGNCDNCDEGRRPVADEQAGERVAGAVAEDALIAPSTRVVHAVFGAGEVLHSEGDRLTVLFDDVGYKTLSLEAVREGKLLETRTAETPVACAHDAP